MDSVNTTTDYDGWLRFNVTGALISWAHFSYPNIGLYVSVHSLDNAGKFIIYVKIDKLTINQIFTTCFNIILLRILKLIVEKCFIFIILYFIYIHFLSFITYIFLFNIKFLIADKINYLRIWSTP